MGQSKPRKKLENPGGGADFKVDPFANLKSMINLAPEPQKSEPKTQEKTAIPEEQARLSKADRELLKVFENAEFPDLSQPKKMPKVNFRRERKGHGGKTVIIVRGLSGLSVEEQMELCQQIKKGLGTGASFEEDELIVRGDQEQRVRDWFVKNNFRV